MGAIFKKTLHVPFLISDFIKQGAKKNKSYQLKLYLYCHSTENACRQ